MKYAYGGSINWTWYLGYEIEEGKVRVLLHDQLHNERDANHPKCEGRSFRFDEDEKRKTVAVYINEQRFELVNPGYVFGYPTF